MAVERITYRANGKNFIGALVHDDRVAGKRPLMLIAPNWLGVSDAAIKRAQMMTGSRYIGFVTDMYGDGKISAGPARSSGTRERATCRHEGKAAADLGRHVDLR